LDLGRVTGTADPMIYGQYLEHVNPDDNCIYGAVVDEGSPLSDAEGYRRDVIEAVKELQVPVVRWPGGCFADIYHWEDGIGPKDRRPARRNYHWGGLESNRFGTDEFLRWCRTVGTAPYINFNLGTGTLDEAIRWLDYCNGVEPTHEVKTRQANGQAEPYNVPLWGIGNEQWGQWEAGHMDAREYAKKLRNWGQFLKKYDPKSKFLGIGSPGAKDPDWDLTVLKEAGHLIDYLTLHMYAHTLKGVDTEAEYYSTVTYSDYFEERLRLMTAVIEAGSAHLDTRPLISVDEWNIRHVERWEDDKAPFDRRKHKLDRKSPRTLRDALFVAGVFNSMLRYADSVGMGNYVFLLNGNAVLRVEPEGIVKTPLYDVFQAYSRYMHPTVLETNVTTESFLTGVRQGLIDETLTRSVNYVDVVATRDAGNSSLALAIVNRHFSETATITVEPERFDCHGPAKVWQLHDESVVATNDLAHPDRLRLQSRETNWTGQIEVPPHSLTIVQVATEARH
jgi:alpha-N-arabinofuranosidase